MQSKLFRTEQVEPMTIKSLVVVKVKEKVNIFGTCALNGELIFLFIALCKHVMCRYSNANEHIFGKQFTNARIQIHFHISY